MYIFILHSSYFTAEYDHIFTLAVGQGTPGPVLQARDGLQLVAAGEGEAIVALEGSRPTPSHVGRDHGKSVVDLRHRATVRFNAVRYVVVVPFTSRLAHGDHLLDSRGEEMSGGAGEADHRAKCGSRVRHDRSLAWLQLGTICGEDC